MLLAIGALIGLTALLGGRTHVASARSMLGAGTRAFGTGTRAVGARTRALGATGRALGAGTRMRAPRRPAGVAMRAELVIWSAALIVAVGLAYVVTLAG